MIRIGNIYLIWRSGPGSRRIPVGIIKRNYTDGTTFSYIKEGLEKAEHKGFLPFSSFKETDKTYKDNVIDIFAQRISKSERNDLSEFYDFWRVDEKLKHDPYYMLAKTQGLLPTDNLEFLADFNPIKDLTFVTEISALSQNKVPGSAIEVGDKLTYELDRNNEYDQYAVKLLIGDKFLGYVKLIHSRIFYKTKKDINVKVVHIERNGILKRVFIEVKL